MRRALVLFVIALGLAGMALTSCKQSLAVQFQEPPLPEGASDVRRGEREPTIREISFVAGSRRERSREIRDFYARWAEARGWKLIPPTADRWSVDQWVSYGLPEQRTHQFAATWKNDDGTESLSLAQVQRGDAARIEVFLVLGPYRVISSPDEPVMTVKELDKRLEGSR